MSQITLTADQQAAYNAFSSFFIDPDKAVFVIEGFSGTGKTTLVEHILAGLPKFYDMRNALLPNRKHIDYEVVLTATTNKAVSNFQQISGRPVATVQSTLGLHLEKDYSTGKSNLEPHQPPNHFTEKLLFIDEASYIDQALLDLIFSMTHNCKIVFIGDPAQLLTPKSWGAPVFYAGFETARLEEVVRQDDQSPIQALSTCFRETVNTGEWFRFKPDGDHIVHLGREAFEQAIIEEFSRPDWRDQDSKVLAWTNRRVQGYNKGLRELTTGTRVFQKGDMAICNHFVRGKGKGRGNASLRTDQLIEIDRHIGATQEWGLNGHRYSVVGAGTYFVPDSRSEWERLENALRAEGDVLTLRQIDEEWADLRAAFSSTINKAQGSTYDQVFLDLDDIKRCRDGEQIARMMYVGVSRARRRVYLTGDLA